MEIEFTDRYGGNPPSWLRGCHGQCEAMGYYPVQTFEKHPPELKAQVERDVYGLYRNLTQYEAILVDAQIEKDGYSNDGWYFIECPKCHKTGRCSWFTTITRIPKWICRGLRLMYDFRPANRIHRDDWNWFQKVWLTFKVAFLCDLGMKI